MLHPTVFNTAQICHQLGVKHAVMSPGSRNAPLTISFARHDEIKKWIIPDERSAGFIALGIAQETKTPVVLCCTSGTALLNYAPAVAEAYYREIPLVILSADRPPELIDQRDGQTIRQFEALKNHVKCSVQLPLIETEEDSNTYATQLVKTLQESITLPIGPVHVNIPFKEPFYPDKDQTLMYQSIEVETLKRTSDEIGASIDVSDYQRVLVLCGQHAVDPALDLALSRISDDVPVLKFPLNNLSQGIGHVDLFINDQKELQPDLLITTGLSVLSKKMKFFLRSNKPAKHIHFDPAGVGVDTFDSNPEHIKSSLASFLKGAKLTSEKSYRESWLVREKKVKEALSGFIERAEFSELKAASIILNAIPKNSQLHLSNSMPVRYADIFGVSNSIGCFSNRGTSGIDGCTSTALGSSLQSEKLNTLITGDLAFLYDRNAFFHNYNVPNLRIIVLNNQGGGIFRLIDGPSALPELEDYFETRHNRTAEYICAENGLEYRKADDLTSLKSHLSTFFEPSDKAKLLEVFTTPEVNQRTYKELKDYIHERIKN